MGLKTSGSTGLVSSHDSTGQAFLSRVTKIAAVWTPCDIVIVAGSAELAIRYVIHGDVVGAYPHLKAEFVVANTALEANAVKPMWEDHRANAFFLCAPVQYDIGILSRGLGCRGKQ